MYKFSHFVERKDEASYNPADRWDWSKNNPGLYSAAGSVIGMPAAAASGPKAGWQTYQKWRGGTASFDAAQAKILDYARKQSDDFREAVIHNIEEFLKYVNQYKTLRQAKPTGNPVVAGVAGVVKALSTSLVNMFHTADFLQFFHKPNTGYVDEFGTAINQLRNALQQMSDESAIPKLEQLIHLLRHKAASGETDYDAM